MEKKPGYVQRTFRLKPETVRALDRYSSATGVSRTFAVEKAITEYLEKCGAEAPRETKGDAGK